MAGPPRSLQLIRQSVTVDKLVSHPLQFLDAVIPPPLMRIVWISRVPPLDHRKHALQVQVIVGVHVEERSRDIALTASRPFVRS